MNDHIVKTFLDLLILALLNDDPMHGYKLLGVIHAKFGLLLSPGTLYPLLLKLESQNLIQVELDSRRKIYSLTPLGKRRGAQIFKIYKKQIKHVLNFIENKFLARASDN